MPIKSFLAWLKRNWPWILFAALILFVMPSMVPGAIFYWGRGYFNSVLHDNLGLGRAWSSFLAVFLAVVYALAFPYSLRWLLFGRKRARALVSTMIILGAPPLLHAVLDANFNRATGAPQKCYIWRPGGEITLSDTCGFDPAIGAERRPLTPEIARIIERQNRGLKLTRVTADPRELTFFDPTTGRPRLWYYQEADGEFALYDAEGFNPRDGSLLHPVTAEVLAQIKDRIAADEARARAEAKAASERAEAAARERANRELVELFAADNYGPGAVIVGGHARRQDDEASVEAARQVLTGLLARLRTKGIPATELSAKVYGSSHYDELMTGETAILDRVGLSRIRAVLLTVVDASCHTAASLSGVLSCTIALDLRIVKPRSRDGRIEHWTDTGAGGTRAEAISRALDLVIGQHLGVLDEI